MVSALLLSGSLSALVIPAGAAKGLARASYQDWLIVAAVAGPLVVDCLIFARAQSGALRATMLAIGLPGRCKPHCRFMTVLEPIIAAALGLTLLHEQLRTGDLRLTLLGAAALTAAGATVALARAHAMTSGPISAGRWS